MAESEPIKDTDLIQKDVFQPSIDQANKFLDVLSKLEGGLKGIAAASSKSILRSKVNTVDDLRRRNEDIKKIADSEKALNEVEKQRIALQKQLKGLEDESVKAKLRYQQANKAQNDVLKQQVILEKAAKGSIVALRAELSTVTRQYNALSAAERNNIKIGRPLLAQQRALTNQLNQLEQAGGNFRRQVGNYGVAVGKIGKGVKGLANLLGELGHAFGINTEAMEKFVGIGSAINHTLKDLNNAQKLQKLATVQSSGAITAETVATEINTAAKAENTVAGEAGVAATEAQAIATGEQAAATVALAGAEEVNAVATEEAAIAQEELNAAQYANPLGLIILGVLALGAALYGLNAYLTQSSEETKKLEKENAKLQKTIEKQNAVFDARIRVAEAELEVLKAQGAPLSEIRAQQAEINRLKEQQLLLDIEGIKSSIHVNKQKIADILVNDSLEESILNTAIAAAKAYGATEKAGELEVAVGLMKLGRSKEFREELEKQELALIEAQASLDVYYANLQVQKANDEKEDADIAKKEKDRLDELEKQRIAHLKEMGELDRQAAEDELKRQQDLTDKLMAEMEMRAANEERIRERMAEDREKFEEKFEGAVQKKKEESDEAFLERLYENNIINYLEYQQALKILRDKADAEEKAKRLNELGEVVELTEKITDAISEAFEKRFDAREESLNREGEYIDEELSRQEDRAREGLDNTLSYQENRKRENAIKEEQLAEQKRRAEERERLAEIYLAFVKGYAEDGDLQANTKALTQALIAEGIAQSLAGNFATGVENFRGRGTGTSDSNIIGFSNGESVVTAAGTAETPGLVTAMNESGFDGAARWAMENIYTPQFAGAMPEDSVRATPAHSDWMGSALLNKLTDIEKKFDAIKTTEITANSLGEIVEKTSHRGITKVITHRRPSW